MEHGLIAGKSLDAWIRDFPVLNDITAPREVFWVNPDYGPVDTGMATVPLSRDHLADAEQRLKRFAPFLARVFPETRGQGGLIESPLVPIPEMKQQLQAIFAQEIPGRLLLKCDSHLAISGSIKARGGIYEVLKHAEGLALRKGLISLDDDYSVLAANEFRDFFSAFSIAVGSTGNLGLSIGIMGATLGFNVHVHMSSDAKQWKKDLLRARGVTVIEYDADYSQAVENGRRQALSDPGMHFIDDEQSQDLFLGYAVAAGRLKSQLDIMGIAVDNDHPLFVYLPCGVGGGPGGICFGLKLVFGDHVHCFFAEPTHAPCMLLGLMTRQHDAVCVQDFGIDISTRADGLAVGRASGFVGRSLNRLISGVYTVEDDLLSILLASLADTRSIFMEPSALAGMPGPARLLKSPEGRHYLRSHGLDGTLGSSVHIVWGTGGSMVPPDVMAACIAEGRLLSRKASGRG